MRLTEAEKTVARQRVSQKILFPAGRGSTVPDPGRVTGRTNDQSVISTHGKCPESRH